MTKPTTKKPAAGKAAAKKPTTKKPATVPGANVSTIRLDTPVRFALAKAAEDDRRSSSALLRIILEDWLHQRGYLTKTPGGWVYSGEDRGDAAPWGGKKPADD
jgi:hypothetical protein